MDELTGILEVATANITADYFLLPIHGTDPIYRERVYCYELYHQMRLLWPDDCEFRLNGEVDKAAHPYFQRPEAPKPDLLIHQPGTGNNYAIVEVKSSETQFAGVRKDIKTLTRFRIEFGYQRAIYLFYGERAQSASELVERIGPQTPGRELIEIWIHTAAGSPTLRTR